jgi:hypothetical protein
MTSKAPSTAPQYIEYTITQRYTSTKPVAINNAVLHYDSKMTLEQRRAALQDIGMRALRRGIIIPSRKTPGAYIRTTLKKPVAPVEPLASVAPLAPLEPVAPVEGVTVREIDGYNRIHINGEVTTIVVKSKKGKGARMVVGHIDEDGAFLEKIPATKEFLEAVEKCRLCVPPAGVSIDKFKKMSIKPKAIRLGVKRTRDAGDSVSQKRPRTETSVLNAPAVAT